jgi:hypothetical protein
MQFKHAWLRWGTGLLSAGGAFFLAACYGPQRPPERPPRGESRTVSGTVVTDSGPVAGIPVCDTRLMDQCPMTDADGRFEIRYFDDGSPTKLCTKSATEGAATRYTQACVEVPPGASSVQITVTPMDE